MVRQSADFPPGRGLLSSLPISPDKSPGGQAVRKRASLIFSKHQMQDFEDRGCKELSEGLRSLCCVPLLRSDRALGVLVLGSTRIAYCVNYPAPFATPVFHTKVAHLMPERRS